MSTFLGTFGTEAFRRAQGGKFVVSSDSGKPVLKQIGRRFSTWKALALQSVRGSRQGRPARFLPLAHSPPSFQAARQLGHLQDADTKTGPDPGKGDLDLPRCSTIAPSTGRAFLSQEQDLMRAAQAEQTLHGQVAGPGFLVLALELA